MMEELFFICFQAKVNHCFNSSSNHETALKIDGVNRKCGVESLQRFTTKSCKSHAASVEGMYVLIITVRSSSHCYK